MLVEWKNSITQQRVLDRIIILFNKTWKESHQAQYVKCIGNFFPVSNTKTRIRLVTQLIKNSYQEYQQNNRIQRMW